MRISDWSSDVALPISGAVAGQFATNISPPNFSFCRARLSSKSSNTGSNAVAFTPCASQQPSKSSGNSLSVTKLPSRNITRHPALLSVSATRSEEHTSELQSLMRISYAVFCLKKKKYQFSLYHNIHILYKQTDARKI